MTQFAVGLTGTTTSGTAGVGAYQTLTGLIKEHAVGKFKSTINDEVPILGKEILRQEKRTGPEYVFTKYAGAEVSTCWIRDFAPLPRGVSIVPVKGRVLPSTVFDRIEIGRDAADAEVDSDEGMVQLLDENMSNSASQTARHLGRGLFGGSVTPQATAAWSGTAALSIVTVPFEDVTMFRAGMAVDFTDTSANLVYTIKVTGVTRIARGAGSANVAGDVSFINDVLDNSSGNGAIVALGATAVATNDIFSLRGTTVGFGGASGTIVNNPIVSFDDIAGAGALSSLYGVSPTTLPGWVGSTGAIGGIYNQEFFLARMAVMRNDGASKPDRCVMNDAQIAAHAASGGVISTTFGMTASSISPTFMGTLDKSRDKYGDSLDNTYSINGVKIQEDPNCPATMAVFWKNSSTYLAWWKEISPDEEGRDPVLVSRERNTYEVQMRGSAQLITEDRKSVLVVTGATNL